MDISLLCLFFLSSFSLGSEIIKPHLPIIGKTSFDNAFISMIDNYKSCTEFVRSDHDLVVFGNHTIFSIFQVLVEMVISFYLTPLSVEDVENFDSLVVNNYYTVIVSYLENDIDGLIKFLEATKSIPFQVFVQNIKVNESPSRFFAKLIKNIKVTVGRIEGIQFERIVDSEHTFETKKLYFQSASKEFTLFGLNSLLERRVVSLMEWKMRKEVAKLLLNLHKSIGQFLDPERASLARFLIDEEEYFYLFDNLSIFNGSEIDFTPHQKLYDQLQLLSLGVYSGNDAEIQRKAALFSLYSIHFYQIYIPKFEKFTQSNARFHSICIISKRKNYIKLIRKFDNHLSFLLPKTIKVIEIEIEGKLKAISLEFPQLFQYQCSCGTTRARMIKFLVKYVNGDFDSFDLSKHLNIRMVKVYLHFLNIDAKVSFMNSFFLKCTMRVVNQQPSLSILDNNSYDHIFVQLISGYKHLCPSLHSTNDKNDLVIFDDNTLVSIFYHLKDIAKFFSLSLLPDDKLSIFNKLVEKFYFPLLEEYSKLFPRKFCQLAINSNSKFPFQIMIFNVPNPKRPIFTQIIHHLDQITMEEIPETKLLSYKVMDMIEDPIRFTKSFITFLLRKPLISSQDWKDRIEIIMSLISLLTDYQVDLNDPDLSKPLDTFITVDVKKYEFIFKNFSIVNGNEVDFQKIQQLFGEIISVPFKRDDEKVALLTLYSHHFLLNPPSKIRLLYINVPLLCFCVLVIDEDYFITECQISNGDIPLSLVKRAIHRLRYNIFRKLSKDNPYYNQARNHFLSQRIPNSKTDINFLRKYAKLEKLDDGNEDLGVSPWMIEIYLHLLHYYRTVNP
jgi:hypothetical protein